MSRDKTSCHRLNQITLQLFLNKATACHSRRNCSWGENRLHCLVNCVLNMWENFLFHNTTRVKVISPSTTCS